MKESIDMRNSYQVDTLLLQCEKVTSIMIRTTQGCTYKPWAPHQYLIKSQKQASSAAHFPKKSPKNS
eukprot:3935373-Rhodomonas_salina.1